MGHLPGLKNDRNEETLYESNTDGMQQQPDDVTIFLNGPSVNYASLGSKEYPLNDLAKLFTLSEGRLLA